MSTKYRKKQLIELIDKYVPTMTEYMKEEHNVINNAIYLIKFNNIPVYIGQSTKGVNRLYTHLHNLFNKSELFGIYKEEIFEKKITISVKLLEKNIKDEEREQAEVELVNKYKPILQMATGKTDRCIPMDKRRPAIEEHILKKLQNISN